MHRHARRLRTRRERVVDSMRARELRQEGGVDVDDPVRKPCEEGRSEQVHVTRQDDEVDAA